MTNRYAWYERLSELASEATQDGAYDLGAAIGELARSVMFERERLAAAVLQAAARHVADVPAEEVP